MRRRLMHRAVRDVIPRRLERTPTPTCRRLLSCADAVPPAVPRDGQPVSDTPGPPGFNCSAHEPSRPVAHCYVPGTRPAEAAPRAAQTSGPHPHSPEYSVPPSHTIAVTTRGGLLTVRLSGEIDSEAMSDLRGALASVSRSTPPALSFDFTPSSFVGLSAMGALLVARGRAQKAQVGVITPGASRAFYRLMDFADRSALFGPTSTSAT